MEQNQITAYLYTNLRRSRDGTFVRGAIRVEFVRVVSSIHSVHFGQLLC